MVRMGIVGLGGISRTHISCYKSMADRVTLQAAAEINEDVLKKVCAEESIPQAYTDPVKMIREADIDALTICMPPIMRDKLIRAAAERGIPVLCEKPLATTLEEANEIEQIIAEHPIPLLVNFKMRQGENFQKIREFLQRPDVGKPLSIMCRYALVTDPEIWQPPKWFWDLKVSGGLLIENGGHIIDYLLWIAGGVESVFAYTEQKTIQSRSEAYMRDTQTEDNAVVIMKHKNDCTTVFLNTICYPGNRDASLELATEGGYFMEIFECRHLRVRKGEKVILDLPEESYSIGDCFTSKHFINDVILNHQKPYVDYKDGVAALKVALAARESAAQKQWVEI